MKKIFVRLPDQQTEVWVGSQILIKALEHISARMDHSRKAFILADRVLRDSVKKLILTLKGMGWTVEVFSVAATEDFKNFESIYPLYGKLLEGNADRNSIVIALGGGVIGDAAGFLAGTYMRGIPWIVIPTTILAQVDSCLGGKTGVNHPIGKNLIGLFHHPSYVICDTSLLGSLLGSLPVRDRISGLGEMVKMGLIMDPKFYKSLEKNWKKVFELDDFELNRVIHQSLVMKAQLVEQDPRDQLGLREVLNFGHTIGHALEAECGYGYLRHGEAVLWGMRAAVYLSVLQGHLEQQVHLEIDGFLASLSVPLLPKELKVHQILKRLKSDKKSRQGKVRFVLLKSIGKTLLDAHVPDSALRQTIRWLMGVSR